MTAPTWGFADVNGMGSSPRPLSVSGAFMLLLILKTLTNRLAGPAATAVALALLVFVGIQSAHLNAVQRSLHNAATETDDLNRQLDSCQGDREALETSIRRQNAEMEALAQLQSEQLARAEKAAHVAAQKRSDAERRVAELLKAEPQGADACSRFMAADRAVLKSLR